MLKNFRIEELVSSHLYQLLGSNAWKLFDREFLLDVDQFVSDIKKDLGVKSVTINDWLWNGRFTQSGFREQNSAEGATWSQHKKGNALDLKFNGCTVKEAFDYLKSNQGRYPSISRVEDISFTPTWLHLDCKPSNYLGIYVFAP